MKRILIVLILSALAPALAWSATPEAPPGDTIGVVRISEGKASIHRGTQDLPAPVGTKLLAGDILSTGPDGSMGVLLRDNSSLSIGPQSSIAIQGFLFAPAEGKMSLLARLAKGTMAYMSGIIGKLAPESVRFETPVATIGIRGTCFTVSAGEPVPN
jgi:hypothetical protein